MQITIKTKNIELTESLEKFINKKIAKIGKFLHDTAELFVEIEKETLHHRKGEVFFAKAMVMMPGKKLMAKVKGSDMGKAIAKVQKEMEMEIKKYKTKMIETPRRQQRKSEQSDF